MTCPAYRDIPTGLFSPNYTVTCAKLDGHKGSHRSPWITYSKICELFQVSRVRLEWFDA